MIEYLYDAVRATAGEDICIAARITDETGELMDIGANLMLHDDLMMLGNVPGEFDGEAHLFNIPGELTSGKKGRYWYCICSNDNETLSFKNPIYLI